MTFKELQDDAMERLNIPLSSTEGRARVKRYINEWYRRLLATSGLTRARAATNVTINLVDGTHTYEVDAVKIHAIYNTANGDDLTEKTLSYFRELDPHETFTGTPEFYAITRIHPRKVSVRFYPIPSAPMTLNADTGGPVTALADDNDEPAFYEDYHYLLSLGARINEYEAKKDERLRGAKLDMRDGIADLRYFIRKSHRRNGRPVRTSKLGGFFTE